MYRQRVCHGIESQKYVRVAEPHTKILLHALGSQNTRHYCARIDAKPTLKHERGSQWIPARRKKIPRAIARTRTARYHRRHVRSLFQTDASTKRFREKKTWALLRAHLCRQWQEDAHAEKCPPAFLYLNAIGFRVCKGSQL